MIRIEISVEDDSGDLGDVLCLFESFLSAAEGGGKKRKRAKAGKVVCRPGLLQMERFCAGAYFRELLEVRDAGEGSWTRMDRLRDIYEGWCLSVEEEIELTGKQQFCRALFQVLPEWRKRKKRKWFGGKRDFVILGVMEKWEGDLA